MIDHPKATPISTLSSGSGGAALAGYEYQIDVSVWLALDLLLANKLAQQLILEPSSEEDLEADLVEHEPGRVTSAVAMDGYRLVVQVKQRSGDAWSVDAIRALLKHGSDGRASAAKRLSSPEIRYLLVTTTGLNGGTRGLSVRHAGAWPKAADMPTSIVKALPSGAAGRVAVMGNQDEERLMTNIRALLTQNFRVPNARWEECHRALREEARIRIRGGDDGRWRRADLEYVIRAHDGYIASSPELEHYVHPTNWHDLSFAMQERNAAIIIGQSGTGKTLATRKLYEELRAKIPGLSRVLITLGPHQISADQTAPPVLYDIEDPWGRFDFDPRSRPWNDQLANFFSHATHDRMIIATSRLDVAHRSGALKTVTPWIVSLESEHYGKNERRKLYRTRIDGLPRVLQRVARNAEKSVLDKLGTPLEIQKFFDAMVTLDRDELKYERKFVADAISKAHQDSIERTVIEQIEERNDIPAATVIWALLKANSRISLTTLRNIEEALADKSAYFDEGVAPLIASFVAARNLRQNEDIVTYYHPRVESGTQQALAAHPLVVRKVLKLLVEVLTCRDGLDQIWGSGVAVRLVAAVAGMPEIKPSPSAAAQNQMDAWLDKNTNNSVKDLEKNLQLAAAAGSAKSTVSELARFLFERPVEGLLGWTYWSVPDRDEAWYVRLRSDPATAILLDAFIRNVLPTVRVRYPKSFSTDIKPLAPSLSLTEAFLAAASEVVHFGVIDSSDAIAEGALQDIASFEEIVDAAVRVRALDEDAKQQVEKEHLAITNGEYSDEYAEHLSNNDDGYTAGEFLEAYISRIRNDFSWKIIAEHRYASALLYYWLRDLAGSAKDSAIDLLELEAAAQAAYGTAYEHMAWKIVLEQWHSFYLDLLTRRIKASSEYADAREAALACLAVHAPQQFKSIVDRFVALQDHTSIACIAVDLAALTRPYGWFADNAPHGQVVKATIDSLPAPFDAIGLAAAALGPTGAPSLSPEALNILRLVSHGTTELRRFRLALDQNDSLPVEDDIRWLLANTDDDRVAAEAVDAAARHGMTAELKSALDHRFARASAQALKALAEPLQAPLPASMLHMAEAKGSFIRQALVETLDSKPHHGHLSALLRLAKDSWSSAWTSHGETSYYPIAQSAIDSIAKLRTLATDTVDYLQKIAIETSDPTLRYKIFEAIAKLADDQARDDLFDLAVKPGRLPVRRDAAYALLQAATEVSPVLLARISTEIITGQDESIATSLTLLLAWRAELRAVAQIASEIATHNRRRVLVLLMIWLMDERDAATARQMAKLLPSGHIATKFALGDKTIVLEDQSLADLGDPMIVAEVLRYVGKKEQKK